MTDAAGSTPVAGVVLAFDTSGPVGYVGVFRDGEACASERLGTQGRHAALLVPTIDRCLARAGLGPESLDGIVVGEGPGSFTGVRVAAATAKGIARARGIPLWTVSSLAAAAVAGTGADLAAVRCALFDARDQRVYAGCWEVGEERLVERVAPHATELAALLAEAVPPGVVFVGDGALRHRTALERAGHAVAPPPAGEPTAEALLRACRLARGTASAPTGWEPSYLKASNAEREWIA